MLPRPLRDQHYKDEDTRCEDGRGPEAAQGEPAMVVVATITVQYSKGWKRRAEIWALTAMTRIVARIAVPTR
jgi:hypothetical protein